MKNIKAIAFDFMGVLGGENDTPLNNVDQILERQFGRLNYQKEYFSWAEKETGLSEEEIRKRVFNIIQKIYYIKEPELIPWLKKQDKYKLALATNHLSYLCDWLKSINYLDYFDISLNSDEANSQKPDPAYYKTLINRLGVNPSEILFIDDREENTKAAEQLGIKTILYSSKNDGALKDVLTSKL